MEELRTLLEDEVKRWVPRGIAINVDVKKFATATIETNLPPWRPVPSRIAARMLGVQLQSLANWRMRDLGPKVEPMRKGWGNRIYYRPDKIAEWLSGGECPDWKFSACWLFDRGLIDTLAIGRHLVLDRIDRMDSLNVFPPPSTLWRCFRETAPSSK